MTNDELRRTLRQQRLSGTTDSPNTFRWDTIHWACDTLNDRALVYELAIWLVQRKRDGVIFGNRGCGKSYLAQEIAMTANEAGFSVCYREASRLLRDIASATASGEDTKELTAELLTVPLLIVDDLDVRTLPRIHAEHFLDLISRRYTKTSTIIISSSSLAELSKYHEDMPVKNALIDRLLHRRNVIEIRSKGD
jgi:DNA replication protein DnaC